MTTAVQNQDYKGEQKDLDPNNHTIYDTYQNINQAFLYEQIKASTAFLGQLTEPIAFNHKIRLPIIFVIK